MHKIILYILLWYLIVAMYVLRKSMKFKKIYKNTEFSPNILKWKIEINYIYIYKVVVATYFGLHANLPPKHTQHATISM